MRVTQYRIEGLGHLSTLVADESSGVAAIVDPRRDVDIYLDAARAADLRITHVVETHLHNDYVSGGRELAALTGATHVIGAGARLAHEHAPAADGDSFDVGSVRFTTLDTPGHTPEHVSYAVADTARADEPFLLLTGGSLLVGAVGRTDLLGAENARPYAAAMYRSLHDVLLAHEDSVMVYPTHGAGSLCSTGISSTSWSTIGFERRHDPLLAPMEVDAFARALLAGQPTIPRYFARMRPTNQAGPRLLGGVVPAIEPLSGDELERALGRARSSSTPARPRRMPMARIPGSLSIPAGSSFGTWLGWLVDADRAGRPPRRAPRRPRRPVTPGDPDRLRGDGRLHRRRLRRRGAGPAGRSRSAAATTSTTSRATWRPAPTRRRSSSMSGRPPNSRRVMCPVPSTSAPAS